MTYTCNELFLKDKTKVCRRYLCLWSVNLCLNEFMDKLNNLVENIKLTFEIEIDYKLLFLEIFNNISIKYSVYRKPKFNNSYIHYYSGQNDNIKNPKLFLRL